MTNNLISEISLSVVHLKFKRIIMTIFIHIKVLRLQKNLGITDVRACYKITKVTYFIGVGIIF